MLFLCISMNCFIYIYMKYFSCICFFLFICNKTLIRKILKGKKECILYHGLQVQRYKVLWQVPQDNSHSVHKQTFEQNKLECSICLLFISSLGTQFIECCHQNAGRTPISIKPLWK